MNRCVNLNKDDWVFSSGILGIMGPTLTRYFGLILGTMWKLRNIFTKPVSAIQKEAKTRAHSGRSLNPIEDFNRDDSGGKPMSPYDVNRRQIKCLSKLRSHQIPSTPTWSRETCFMNNRLSNPMNHQIIILHQRNWRRLSLNRILHELRDSRVDHIMRNQFPVHPISAKDASHCGQAPHQQFRAIRNTSFVMPCPLVSGVCILPTNSSLECHGDPQNDVGNPLSYSQTRYPLFQIKLYFDALQKL